ncbi:hypothetical protein N798_07225 [Knoellia flava TL1]|uniref:LysR family transcriptional regulator n=1 Tax=Knoellia flava TL1 TaxID=1385518 RepID=A0ABR4XFH8_9MICO|nr:hypothetical protein N798_07225 [Knoellia flava TL1]
MRPRSEFAIAPSRRLPALPFGIRATTAGPQHLFREALLGTLGRSRSDRPSG